jgi:hypothetical protein
MKLCPYRREMWVGGITTCQACMGIHKGGYLGQWCHLIRSHPEILEAPYEARCLCGLFLTDRDEMFAHLGIQFPFVITPKETRDLWAGNGQYVYARIAR